MQFHTPNRKVQISFPSTSSESSPLNENMISLEDSNWSEIVCSKTDQYAKLIAVRKMNSHYKKEIAKLKQKMEELNRQGESSLSVLEAQKNDLHAENSRLSQIYQSNPSIELLESQLTILHSIKEQYAISITDDRPFREIGLLKMKDDIHQIPNRIYKLLKKLNQQKHHSLSTSITSIQRGNIPMQEAVLRRRYKVLKQTTEGSIKKAIVERENMRNEILALKEKLNIERSNLSMRRSIAYAQE
ncbi:hypothetical protein TRFO_12303 [Tritrichomonas foetus]|uniref:Uncharacterized protein n=1 Tax=Tritrichomonas foetus TaxID=1144522 RepID=A0A1J4IZZ6_9EUKA|nr:hypothetical protein TRFO_12303 [Tritrichomonas foetus]|eukprot:OHS92754.1 hypothetical protein TRFO_12303 [Tritrichomonas foetus]